MNQRLVGLNIQSRTHTNLIIYAPCACTQMIQDASDAWRGLGARSVLPSANISSKFQIYEVGFKAKTLG